jgi:MFS family permease
LRILALTGALAAVTETAWATVQPLFLLRDLRLGALSYGVLLAAAAVGGLFGPILAPRLISSLGTVKSLIVLPLVTSLFAFLMPLAQRGWGVLLYGAGAGVVLFGAAVYNIAQLSLRQRISPDHLRGRINGSMRFLMWGAMPLGGLLGGVLAAGAGMRPALWICAVGMVITYLPLAATTVIRRGGDELARQDATLVSS